MAPIAVTYYSDPGCPWAYSANPALGVLRWRYGKELDWRLVTIGLTERGEQYERRGYTPVRSARGYRAFRRYGMPFATEPRRRIPGTARACRAIVATRLRDPANEYAVFRALQLGWFTTPLVLDEDEDIAPRSAACPVSTPRRSSPRSTTRTWSRPTRPTAPRRAPPPAAQRSSRARRRTPTATSASRRRRSCSRRATAAGSRRAASRPSRRTTCWSQPSTRRYRAATPPPTRSRRSPSCRTGSRHRRWRP